MPIWGRAKSVPASDGGGTNNNNSVKNNGHTVEEVEEVTKPTPTPTARKNGGSKKVQSPPPPVTNRPPSPPTQQVVKPKLVFHCQLADGSPTGIISGFTSIKELYEKIAQCYDFPSSEILFCTLNTHKVDMNSLLGGQIGLEDFIFAHKKGQPKEIELTKTEEALGLTITDNGAGYCFIKKIREDSVIDRTNHIHVGDHIERIDRMNLIGKKHYEVAKMLKEITKGSTFTLRLVEPLKAGFANIGPRSNPSSNKKGYGSGKATLRIRSTGQATVEDAPDDIVQAAVEKINNLLESFLGINDTDLATLIWEMGESSKNTIDFSEELEKSDLKEFGFNDDLVFDLWGVISDAKSGRL